MTSTIIHMHPTPDSRPSIVIVDDEQSILSSLRSLLRRQGYDLQLFTNGFHAVEYLSHHTPDIIVSDMRMPEMSGMEFLDRAAELCPTSTRMMLTGYEDKLIILDAIAHSIAQQYIMKPWEDDDLLKLIANVIQTRQELQRQHLDQLLQSISSFPSPPHVHKQLQRILENDTRSVKELASVVEKDPAIVARLLRMANSIYYSTRVPISTALEAVSFIGADYVESLILGMGILHHAEEKIMKEYGEQLDELWRRALHRAMIARSIAEQWPGFKQPPVAYTVCLLQDIGFIVRFNTDPEKCKRFVQAMKTLHVPMHEAESRIYSVPHAAVGAALLRLWNFPESIVSAIEHHHGGTNGDALTQIAQIADIVESGDTSCPHDPLLNPMIEEWIAKNK